MLQSQFSSMRGPIKALEADISHANALADTIQRAYGGACLHMRLSCNNLAPFFIFLMQCMDCTCSYSLLSFLGIFQIIIYKVYVDGESSISTSERRANLKEFYAVIYPSLQQLESSMVDGEACSESGRNKEIVGMKRMEDWEKFSDDDLDREDECGICLEVCSKMVLPSCSHSMCLKCYRDWNVRSQSCPFCRGSLKRVRSRDLWVLTNNEDILDTMTLEKDNVRRFYCYIDSLPLMIPDNLFLVYYDYLI
ncbi:E3 ubiquitin-protein ligase AIRP2-like isoform X1 [Zingiber officinale]|uniref:E3 ubiquitin-protein ligase AIRP2-like isoform X1 n=1 Tax=Zingiber officinale TaxID=94328 RepID=UPI001C4AAB66|nr:E3 ubiquitin-protein ligase AIRP2-like isoform X1 [Zingiber officinale]